MARGVVMVDGAEAVVETGFGVLTGVDVGEGKRNAYIKIQAEHLRDPVTGWYDTLNADGFAVIQDAHANGRRVSYRVVVKRKPKVDKGLPFDQLNRHDKVRDLAECRLVTAADQAPAERHVGSAPLPPAEGQKRELASSSTSQEAPGHPQRAEPPPAAPASPTAPPAEARPAGPPVAQGPRVQEGKPWEFSNSDGSMNLGSYAFMATMGMVDLAVELLGAEISPDEQLSLNPKRVRSLASSLLEIADRAQAMVREDGHVDRMDSSHTRARGAVRTLLYYHEVPWGASPEVRQEWITRFAQDAAELMRVAISLNR